MPFENTRLIAIFEANHLGDYPSSPRWLALVTKVTEVPYSLKSIYIFIIPDRSLIFAVFNSVASRQYLAIAVNLDNRYLGLDIFLLFHDVVNYLIITFLVLFPLLMIFTPFCSALMRRPLMS